MRAKPRAFPSSSTRLQLEAGFLRSVLGLFEIPLVLGYGGKKPDAMTKAERLQFMRARFRTHRGFALVEIKPKDTSPKRSYHFDAFGVPQHLRGLRQKRIYAPDPKPTLHIAHKRTARVSALTKIVQKW